MPDGQRRMVLLIDENAPKSVGDLFEARGHEVHWVKDELPSGSPDPLVAAIGDKLSAIVVSWDKDFEGLVSRVPKGNKRRFRNLGRISFKCAEPKARSLLEKWIAYIEFHYDRCFDESDFRMIVEIQRAALKFM